MHLSNNDLAIYKSSQTNKTTYNKSLKAAKGLPIAARSEAKTLLLGCGCSSCAGMPSLELIVERERRRDDDADDG